jgi:hypothetical protein
MLKNMQFVGSGGKMDWGVAGLSGEPYCDFGAYNFNAKSSKITVEGATLNYPTKTDKPVQGIFEFDSKKRVAGAENNYPRFKSFGSDIVIKGLGENISYHGGFSMSGKRVYSSSIDEGIAYIEIKHAGVTRIKSHSNRFEMGDSLIHADVSTIVLFQGTDSISHPGTIFTFNKSKEILRLKKQPSFRQAPFIDTYHKIEIVADALTWNLNNPRIDFDIVNAKDQIAATFESEEFFSADKYASLQAMYRFHPLQMLFGYYEKVKVDQFYAGDVAAANKQDVGTVKGSMVSLMKAGFIDYNIRTGLITMRPKAKHYVISRRGKKDYDNITFISKSPGGSNATLDLTNNELTVRGVDKVYISDSLSVFFEPEGREIKIMKNRDFKFNGKINTQAFQFIGKEFQFVYDSFLVHLPTIDAIRMAVAVKAKASKSKEKAAAKEDKVRVLGNELTSSSGTLYIDKPNNKSGRKRYDQYPIFDAKKGATVVFNKPNIAQGAYDTTMQFKIPPFKLDSLSSHDPKNIGFDGEFVSGGIFPPFKEKLVVMPDYSLGFEHKVPKDGFQLYEGKAKYFNKVTLNNQGLRGDGEIQYFNTTLYSKDFFFLKDSVFTVGTKCITKEGPHPDATPEAKYPEMAVEKYKLKWIPRADQMFISDTKDPITFYNKTATLQGTANVTSRGMFGEGILLTRGSETESRQFHFEKVAFSAKESIFKINSDNPAKPALLCKNVKLSFDLEKAEAHFNPEVIGEASNEFPFVQYKSSLDNGVWDLKKKIVTMKMPDGGDINKSYFYTTRLEQDSLVFNATEGIYDIPKQSLNIKGIPVIKVADGLIYPDKNEVVVEENAVIQTLKNAKITLDTLEKFHHLFDGLVDIKSKNRFEGMATYQFVNLGGDTLSIKFQEFQYLQGEKKKDGAHTVAQGLIKEEDSLVIGPKVLYKGKVTMYANKKNLYYDGYLKLDLKGELQYSQWLKYKNDGDTNVVINLEKPTADNGNPLTSGLHFGKSDFDLYTTFISEKKLPTDDNIFVTTGMLNYDAANNEFTVATKEKIANNNFKGSLLSYNDSKSTIKFQSKFNFIDANKNLELIAVGSGKGTLKTHEYSFNTLIAFDPKMHKSITEAYAKNLKMIGQLIPDTSSALVMETREKNLPYKISEFVGNSGVEKYMSRKFAAYTPLATLSKDLAQGFVFSDVDLRWSQQHKAYYSVGPIFVANVLKEDVGKSMNGFIEIKKLANGDAINIYLEPTPEAWYFITYEENRMATITSNPDLNQVVQKRSKGEMPDRSKFFFVLGEENEKRHFLNTFKENYLGIKPTIEQLEPEPEENDGIPAPSNAKKKSDEIKDEAPKEDVSDGAPEPVEEETYETPKPVNKKRSKKYQNNTGFDDNIGKEDEESEGNAPKEQNVDDKKKAKKDRDKMKLLMGN